MTDMDAGDRCDGDDDAGVCSPMPATPSAAPITSPAPIPPLDESFPGLGGGACEDELARGVRALIGDLGGSTGLLG